MPTPEARQAALKADPRLDAYFSDEVERRRVTREMFDEAAAGYDEAERWTGLGTGPWYRREVLRRNGLRPGMHILDVAAGTGLVTVAAQGLVGPEGRVIALDPSPGMLGELKKKLSVETLEGYAEDIPLPDPSVDFISMGYALRHVGDLDRAFADTSACCGRVARSASWKSAVLPAASAVLCSPAISVGWCRCCHASPAAAPTLAAFGNTTATPSTLHWSRNRSWPRCVQPVSAMCAARSPSASSASTWRASPKLAPFKSSSPQRRGSSCFIRCGQPEIQSKIEFRKR